MRKILILSLLLLFFACPKEEEQQIEPKDVIDLLPADNEISGWIRSSQTEIAENETQLWAMIDGAGQPYVDNDFVKFVRQYYGGDVSGAPATLELHVADMGDTTNAKNVYDDFALGTETPWTDNHAGVEARIDESPLFAYNVSFWDDRFYSWMSISDKSQAALDIAKLFALNISAAIRDTTQNQ